MGNKLWLCACGWSFVSKEGYIEHRKKCTEYPWDETDEEASDGK